MECKYHTCRGVQPLPIFSVQPLFDSELDQVLSLIKYGHKISPTTGYYTSTITWIW